VLLIDLRYLYALGRDRAIPPVFARKSKRTGSAWVASLSHTAFSAVVLLFCAVQGLDPYPQLTDERCSSGAAGQEVKSCTRKEGALRGRSVKCPEMRRALDPFGERPSHPDDYERATEHHRCRQSSITEGER
jgi:hypothetical protein